MFTLMILLSGAVITDLSEYRIPNSFIIFGLLSGVYHQVLSEGLNGLSIWFFGMVFPIVLLFPVFLIGGLGAGDIKLLAVTGGYFGFCDNLKCLALAIVIGAMISLVKLLVHKNLLTRFKRFYFCTQNIVVSAISGRAVFCDYRETGLKEEGKNIIHFSIPIALSAFLVVGGIV